MSDGGRTALDERPRPTDGAALPVARGTVIAGKYRVDDIIASGGMGVVASGEHIKLSQRVAIKFLRAWSPDGVARFEREARACARIQSEHIARVIDVDVLPNGTPFMVMEFLVGMDLSIVVKERGHLPVAEAVDYVLQACEALAEAHRNDIIHRDLKPANIFLTRRPDGFALIKVLDFGISKIRSSDLANPSDELTTTNALMGSPSYMSPEQLRASKDIDARADVWGLGAVLYKLVAGRNPFVGESTPELGMKILTEPVSPIEEGDLPPGFFDVIRKCLEKERDGRYANVADLAEALRPWGPGASVDSVVRTLSAAPGPADERTATPPNDTADTRVATTIDPSVSDARSTRSWRAPIVGVALAVVGVGVVTFAVVTHKTAASPPAPSETARPVVASASVTEIMPPPTPTITTQPLPASASLTHPPVVVTATTKTTPAGGAIVRSFPTTSRPPQTPPTASTVTEFERFGERK